MHLHKKCESKNIAHAIPVEHYSIRFGTDVTMTDDEITLVYDIYSEII